MFTLTSLPAETLADITDYLQAREVAKLWLSGHKALINILSAQGGVRTFNYKFQSKTAGLWPHLVCELTHLRSFIMKDIYCIGFPLSIGDSFLKLPSNLTRIETRFEGDATSFLTALSLQPERFSKLKYLEISCTGDPIGIAANKLPPTIDKLPSGLEYLALQYEYLIADHIDFFPLRNLPYTLTTLIITATSFDPLEGSTLPPLLTFLDAMLTGPREYDWMPMLPPGLLTCSVRLLHKPQSVLELDWSALPRTLTSFSTDMGEDTVSEENLRGIPPNLTGLDLYGDVEGHIPAHLIHLLPKSLTTIENLIFCDIDSTIAEHLPSSLRSLSQLDPSAIPFLPPSITSVSFKPFADASWAEDALPFPDHWTSIEIDQISEVSHLLPPNLLSLVFSGTLSTETVACLPHTLTELCVTVRENLIQSIFEEAPLIFLPPRLRLLQLNMSLPYSVPVDLSSESSSWLPRSLTEFSMGDCTIAEGWFLNLPRNLISLTLRPASMNLEDFQNLQQTCDNLQCLTLFTPFLDNIIEGLRFLPNRLRCLSLAMDGDSLICDQDLEHLPNSLLSITIPDCPGVSGSCKSKLPPGLEEFYMDYMSPDWFEGRPTLD